VAPAKSSVAASLLEGYWIKPVALIPSVLRSIILPKSASSALSDNVAPVKLALLQI